MNNIAFYGSHNAAVVVEQDGKIVTVVEIERFLSVKNAGYSQYSVSQTRKFLIKEILKYIEKEFGISEYDTCIQLNTDTLEGTKAEDFVFYDKLIPAKKFVGALHHESHAACGFYQTDYQEALIVSFDGGGNDGLFNIYHAKDRKTIELLEKNSINVGFPYMSLGEFLGDIRKEPTLDIGNLVYSGKIMGLASYGEVNEEWLPAFEEYYKASPEGPTYLKLLEEVTKKTGLVFDTENRYTDQTAWDIAKTSQIAFENVVMEVLTPHLEEYPEIPLIVVGGCGLNILFNTMLYEKLDREIFVPPNPNDCGIATGMMLNFIKPDKAVDITYAGIGILDKDTLMSYAEEFGYGDTCHPVSIKEVVSDLEDGKIVGVVRDTCEHGPRALGNRSILCNPAYPEMKDILNAKVKNREWYRPFAPVCRLEDVSKYFNFEGESRWMSFCPTVKEEWKEKLTSITHVDGTARVQTVTKEQNEWLYNLLTEFEKVSGVGVLLNTSFNINGKPILSRYSDAIKVYRETEMDRLLLQDYYFIK